MPESLEELIGRLRRDADDLAHVSEDAVKQAIIMPVLAKLGWDRDNIREVVPEFSSGSGRVDYCLRIGDRSLVFLEAKNPNEDLDRHEEQLLKYAFQSGVEIAVLTNGFVWWFYLPLSNGNWDERKFFAIDICQQDLSAVVKNFAALLARQAIADGSAQKKAKEIHADRTRGRTIKQNIPKAWDELCREPDELLVQLLVEKVESLCGHRPSDEDAAKFIVQWIRPPAPVMPNPVRTLAQPPSRQSRQFSHDWTGKKPVTFTFDRQQYPVRNFKEILITLATILRERHGAGFRERAFQLRGRTRTYFAPNGDNMTSPCEIPDTGIFVETNLPADGVRKICLELLSLFDYPDNSLHVEFN
jgi:predicted type IV restriction endonuclease